MPIPEAAPIFERAEAPASHRSLAINRYAEWFTFSNAFRKCIRQCEEWLRALPEPELTHIRGLSEYDYTFALSAPAPDALRHFARSLCNLKRPRRILLFTRLLDRRLDGYILRRLFALLRGCIAEELGDQRFSLYAPLGTIGQNAGDFKLHADLYLPELLFNVFEDVPSDSSGASIFLRSATLCRLAARMRSIPPELSAAIAECFTLPPDADRFHRLFDLLHDPASPWVPELEAAMRARQFSIKLSPGEGYLIHDRTWLHGRESPRGGVSGRRVHRLVFNTTAMQRKVKAGSFRGSA